MFLSETEERHRGEGHMKIEAEIGIIQIAIKCWMRQGMESPLEPPTGVQPCQHLKFGLLPSRTVRKTV